MTAKLWVVLIVFALCYGTFSAPIDTEDAREPSTEPEGLEKLDKRAAGETTAAPEIAVKRSPQNPLDDTIKVNEDAQKSKRQVESTTKRVDKRGIDEDEVEEKDVDKRSAESSSPQTVNKRGGDGSRGTTGEDKGVKKRGVDEDEVEGKPVDKRGVEESLNVVKRGGEGSKGTTGEDKGVKKRGVDEEVEVKSEAKRSSGSRVKRGGDGSRGTTGDDKGVKKREVGEDEVEGKPVDKRGVEESDPLNVVKRGGEGSRGNTGEDKGVKKREDNADNEDEGEEGVEADEGDEDEEGVFGMGFGRKKRDNEVQSPTILIKREAESKEDKAEDSKKDSEDIKPAGDEQESKQGTASESSPSESNSDQGMSPIQAVTSHAVL